MSYDGLFQLGMGAVLLKASQTEDTTAARARAALARMNARTRGLPGAAGALTAPAGAGRRDMPDRTGSLQT